MVFAVGGPSAVETMKASPFDVVVTDMRMPVIDGAELLRQVKEAFPRAVRIVLSGQTDADTAMKTVFTAHQFLAKPCDPEKLREVVRRACDLHALVTSEELRSLAGDVSQLPVAPRTYLAITEALAEPACSVDQVASIVERDPALSAKVLQLVNSAFFGMPRSVTSIARATSYLGTLTLKNVALAMESLAAAQQLGQAIPPRDLLAFQVNALLVGSIGRHWYAGDRSRGDNAFVAGLLRGMGSLLLAAQGRAQLLGGESHAALSAYLLGLWGLPHGVLEPVAFHQQPERVEHAGLEVVDVVNLAHHVAAELAPCVLLPDLPPLDTARFEALGVTAASQAALRADAAQLLIHTRKLLRA